MNKQSVDVINPVRRPPSSPVTRARAMASVDSHDVDVPESWPTSAMRALDAALRCAICGDIFALPVSVKTCAHAFCSDCIRRALRSRETCPSCRESARESDLVPNKALEHVARCFKDARREMLDAVRSSRAVTATATATTAAAAAAATAAGTRTKTGTKTPKDDGTGTRLGNRDVVLMLSESESESEDVCVERPSTATAPCPVCNAHVSMRLMNTHLNACLVKNETLSSPAKKVPTKVTSCEEKIMKKLPKLAYHVFQATKLRDMCKKEGLNASGDKKQLEARHKEFTTRVNSIIEYGRVPDLPAIAREVNREEARKAGAGAKARMFNTTATTKEKAAVDAARTDNETFARLIEEVRARQKRRRNSGETEAPPRVEDADDWFDDDDDDDDDVLPLSQVQPKYVTSDDDER